MHTRAQPGTSNRSRVAAMRACDVKTRALVGVADCGHTYNLPLSGFGASGYAVTPRGRTLCYACCTAKDNATMKAARPGARFFAYLGQSDKTITNWPGDKLGDVVSCVRRTTYNFCISRRLFVTVRDNFGNMWHGSGPADSGTYVRLTRSK